LIVVKKDAAVLSRSATFDRNQCSSCMVLKDYLPGCDRSPATQAWPASALAEVLRSPYEETEGEAQMAHGQQGHHAKAKQPSGASWIPPEFALMGGKPVEALVEMQKQILDSFDEANRAWLARARLEAVLGIELVNRLTTAHSIHAVASAYAECMSRHLDMLAEDGRRMLDDSKRLLKSGTRVFTNGSSGPPT
jgi:hypothetical protein